MEITELNKRTMSGEPILTGKFMECKIQKTQTGVEFENTIIAGTKNNFEFKRFAKKGTPIGEPRYKFVFGSPVAVLGFNVGIRDGFLSTDTTGIELVEQ